MSVFGLTYRMQDKHYMSHIYDFFIYYHIKNNLPLGRLFYTIITCLVLQNE